MPGATLAERPTPVAPMSLDSLLADVQLTTLLYEEDILMQPTMLQPVGSMDRLPLAIAGRLRNPVRLHAEVQEIRQHRDGVRIVYRNTAAGRFETVEADHAIIKAPLPVLRKTRHDFSGAIARAIATANYSDAVKVAFESAPFWERQQIYGGNSYVDGDTGSSGIRAVVFNRPVRFLSLPTAGMISGRVWRGSPSGRGSRRRGASSSACILDMGMTSKSRSSSTGGASRTVRGHGSSGAPPGMILHRQWHLRR